jgi:uncharacterized SAM-binding protein YcdF (DUF218 family)
MDSSTSEGIEMSTIGFLVKKSIGAITSPLGIGLILLIVGAVLWHRRPTSRRGLFVVVVGILWLWFISLPITGFLLLRPLELESGDYAKPSELASRGVKNVAVLSAVGEGIDKLSPADRWSGEGLLRLMEGVRIWDAVTGGKLFLSVGHSKNPTPFAVLPTRLGVPQEALVVKTLGFDTIDEAYEFLEMLGREQQFALVTSAYHIPRSMEIFRSLGMQPIACPCDFRTKEWPDWYGWLLPTAGGLSDSHLAFHEYLGRLWLSLRKSLFRISGIWPRAIRLPPKNWSRISVSVE